MAEILGEVKRPIQAIDIFVPTHGQLKLTMTCIESLYTNTKVPFHLIVCDDSTDLTPLYFRSLEKEKNNITFIHSDEPYKNGNQFFNIALANCKTSLMATVMNSIRVEPDWETVAINLMNNDPKVGIIGFKCLFPSGLIESAGLVMNGFTPSDLGRESPGHRLNVIYETVAVQLAFAMIRKEACIGRFDEKLYRGFVGWDDIDDSFAVRQAGWKILYDGMGVGYHEPRATRGSSTFRAILSNHLNAETFYKRWGFWDAYKAGTAKPADYQGLNELAELQAYEATQKAAFEVAQKNYEEAQNWTKGFNPPVHDSEAIPAVLPVYPAYNPMMGTR